MKLSDKYIKTAEYEKLDSNGKSKEKRAVVSNGSYATAEMIEHLINKLEDVRVRERVRK